MNYPYYVEQIIERIEEAGYEAYVVGGGLRDMMLGREPNDFDVTTSASPSQTMSLFSDMKTIPTGIKHGTVTVICNSHPVEVTTFRIDGSYLDSRHPESVLFTSDIKNDLARRDFTMNAIAYNKKRGIIDPFGGADDIKAGIIRAVGDPQKRMREDALRIMRALRFSAQLGFSIEKETVAALESTCDGLANISGERLGVELQKLVCAPHCKEAVSLMCSLSVLKYILGDYRPSEKVISTLPLLPQNPVERLACLLWEADRDTAHDILCKMKYSNEQKHGVLSILDAKHYPAPKNDVDVRRFIRKYSAYSEAAARVRGVFEEADLLCVNEIERIRDEGVCEKITDLKISGTDLIALGVFGKNIGKALNELLELVTLDPSMNTKEALTSYVLKIKETPDDFWEE